MFMCLISLKHSFLLQKFVSWPNPSFPGKHWWPLLAKPGKIDCQVPVCAAEPSQAQILCPPTLILMLRIRIWHQTHKRIMVLCRNMKKIVISAWVSLHFVAFRCIACFGLKQSLKCHLSIVAA
jgi:hypothetical protein